jgi:hypothetical protein
MRRLALLLAVLLLAVTAVASCGTPLDEAGARKAATDHFMAMPHEAGSIPQDVAITDVKAATRDGRAGWVVAINGRIIMPGLPDGYLTAVILFVDASNRQVTVVARG